MPLIKFDSFEEAAAWASPKMHITALTCTSRNELVVAFTDVSPALSTNTTYSRKNVPTVAALQRGPQGTREIRAMAGIFAVPPGAKFNVSDGESAPEPLLVEDCDLSRFSGLLQLGGRGE